MPQRVIFLKHFYRRCHNLWNDKDRPILGSLSKHRSRWEGVGSSSQISDICSIISLPLFHFISFLWNGIGIEYFFTSTSQFVTYIFGILTKLWVFSFFPFSSEAAAVVEKRASYVTEKVFLLHDLLPQPVRLKSPETVVGLQDLAKKLKLFPLSLFLCCHEKHKWQISEWQNISTLGWSFVKWKQDEEKVVILVGG